MIHETSAGDGTIRLDTIALGTYDGSVSFLGFSSNFAGNAASQASLQVGVSMSYWVIGILIIVVLLAVAVLVALFWWPRRRGSNDWRLPWSARQKSESSS